MNEQSKVWIFPIFKAKFVLKLFMEVYSANYSDES